MLVLCVADKEVMHTMYDYMRALHQQFCKDPDCAELRQEIKSLRLEITDQLPPQQKKQLLKLTDLSSSLQDETAFTSFLAGFRLAWCIAKELDGEEPFSFIESEEHRSGESM
jgi:acetyl-CoA carboxylase carboxyltransferase component